jgi:aspartate aminotransferase
MNALLSPRMRLVRPSPTAEISDKVRALAASGARVIDLGEGELHFQTPEHVASAGIQAIVRGDTKYTAVGGTAPLKKAIVAKFREENGLSYISSEVIAGTGAKQLIFNALLATLGPGDEVIVPAPYWVSYPDMVAIAEGVPVLVECTESDGWKLTPHALRRAITPRTRWVILNSPNNPTGAIYSREELAGLAAVLRDAPHVLLMADDIYEHLRYGAAFATLAEVAPELRDRTLTVNGVSKAYSMTGWRIGYAGGPAWLIAAMQTLQSQSTSNPSSISQAAAVAALEGDRAFMAPWIAELEARRDIVVAAVNTAAHLRCGTPEGAFYVFADCRAVVGLTTPRGQSIANDFEFATYLLEEAHVAVVHGGAFGAPGYFRIAYAIDRPILHEACERLVAACARLG